MRSDRKTEQSYFGAPVCRRFRQQPNAVRFVSLLSVLFVLPTRASLRLLPWRADDQPLHHGVEAGGRRLQRLVRVNAQLRDEGADVQEGFLLLTGRGLQRRSARSVA